MAAEDDTPPAPRRPRRATHAAVYAGGAVGIVAVLLLAAWLSRNSVGERLAVDYLRKRGVPATIRLTRLDAGGVAGSLVVGPAAAPTLTVDRFEADFAPGSVLARSPQVRRLVLVRPRLALRYDGRRLDFGALRPLVDEAMRAKPGGGPQPDVRVEDGLLRLASPWGPLVVEAAGEMSAGRLRRADLHLLPATLHAAGAAAEGLDGRIGVRPAGADALSLQSRFTARAVRARDVAVRTATATVDGVVPYHPGDAYPFAGTVGLRATATAATVEGSGARAGAVKARLSLEGRMTMTGGPTFDGRGEAEAQADAVSADGARLARPTLQAQAQTLTLRSGSASASGVVEMRADGGGARAGGEAVALGPLRLAGTGHGTSGSRGVVGAGSVSLSARAALAPAAARRLAARWAPGAYGADLRPALARSLGGMTLAAPAVQISAEGGLWRAALARPAVLSAEGGGRLEVARASAAPRTRDDLGGALAATLSGGGFPQARLAVSDWRAGARGVTAAFKAQAQGSAGPLREASLELAGGLTARGADTRITAAACAPFGFKAFMGDKGVPLATGASGRACPLPGAPLLALSGDRWRVGTRILGLALAAPPAKLTAVDGQADARMQGAGGAISGEIDVSRVEIRDTDMPRRFNPLSLSGPARLSREVWTARMAAALARGHRPLGPVVLTQDLRSGAGSLTLNAPDTRFAPDGLQPAAVLPALTTLATEVSGSADVALSLGWKGEETTGTVHVYMKGLQGKTVGGLAKGVRGVLDITSLDPLASLPDQTVTAERLETVVPLTDLKATYKLGKDVVDLASASATLAGGRVTLDPMRVGLLPDSTMTGVVRAEGVQLGGLMEAVNLSRAVQIDARLKGALPFSLGPAGLRLADGRLEAMGPGRLTLKREALTGASASGGEAVAATPTGAPVPPPQTSAVQDFAFQALEDLAFSELSAEVGSRPQGRLGVVFHIRGLHDPPKAQEARVGLIDLVRGKAFDKPIPLPKGTGVNLTLDTSLNMDDLLAAYAGLSPTPGSAQVQPDTTKPTP